MIVPPWPSRGKPIVGKAGGPAPKLTAEQRLLVRCSGFVGQVQQSEPEDLRLTRFGTSCPSPGEVQANGKLPR